LDIGTFNVHVLGSDIFTELFTRALNDLFHTVVKQIKELSIQIDSKKSGILVTVHQKYFLLVN